MSSNIIGLINMECPNYMKELSGKRPLASEPFAGKYRLMDFTLSSMVNAGVDTVGLMLPFHARSVLDHVRSAKEWDLARKQNGLYYLPVDEEDDIVSPREGDIHKYNKNLRYVEATGRRYMILAGCDVIHNIDFKDVFNYHRHHNADITLVYKTTDNELPTGGWAVNTEADGRVKDMKKADAFKPGSKVFLGALLIDCNLFIRMIRKAFAQGRQHYFNEVLSKNIRSLRVFGYGYEGYASRVTSIQAYFKASMDILDLKNAHRLFSADNRFYTKIKDAAPAKYMEEAHVTNSRIANGCVIEGRVENSILSRHVRVGRNAVIKNSIIMQNTVIGEDARLEYVICDKNQDIQPEAVLTGTEENPLCVTKRELV